MRLQICPVFNDDEINSSDDDAVRIGAGLEPYILFLYKINSKTVALIIVYMIYILNEITKTTALPAVPLYEHKRL